MQIYILLLEFSAVLPVLVRSQVQRGVNDSVVTELFTNPLLLWNVKVLFVLDRVEEQVWVLDSSAGSTR